MPNKATARSYSRLKHFIKETRIWTLRYHFQLQKKLTEITEENTFLKNHVTRLP